MTRPTKLAFAIICLALALTTKAQTVTDPLITSWKLNLDSNKINGILTDVEDVHYDNSNVYVHSSGVPSYYSFNNPNINDATDQNATWKFTRTPQANTGTPSSSLGGGQMGLFKDGDPCFNAEDARSYQNANNWHQIAFYFEYNDFDTTWGHSTPSPSSAYHHHVLNLALADTAFSGVHSPIVGYMFDGYPIYGPFGYSDPNNANSGVTRMTSSYAFATYTTRTAYADGTALQPSQYGPAVGGQYPIGCYREDYLYTAGSGTLDAHNGRLCKTPEYPNGTYAYFCTIDSNNKARYPFTIGQSYYGVVGLGNQGPQGGKNVVPGTATLYVPATTTGINELNSIDWSIYPNPAKQALFIKTTSTGTYIVQLSDLSGKTILSEQLTDTLSQLDVAALAAGTYVVTITDSATGKRSVNKCVKM